MIAYRSNPGALSPSHRSIAPQPLSLPAIVERAIRHHGLTATRFGREAVGDPNLVPNLRAGREVRPKMEARLRAYLRRLEEGA